MSDASEAPVTQDPMPTGTPQSGGGTEGGDFRVQQAQSAGYAREAVTDPHHWMWDIVRDELRSLESMIWIMTGEHGSVRFFRTPDQAIGKCDEVLERWSAVAKPTSWNTPASRAWAEGDGAAVSVQSRVTRLRAALVAQSEAA